MYGQQMQEYVLTIINNFKQDNMYLIYVIFNFEILIFFKNKTSRHKQIGMNLDPCFIDKLTFYFQYIVNTMTCLICVLKICKFTWKGNKRLY